MGGGSHAHTARGQGAVGGVNFDTESRTDREPEVGGILELERRALGIIHSYSEPGEEQQGGGAAKGALTTQCEGKHNASSAYGMNLGCVGT